MGLFSKFKKTPGTAVDVRKPVDAGEQSELQQNGLPEHLLPALDESVMRRNNLSLLTLDEKWNKLFVKMPISPSLEKAQNDVNALIKRDSLLQQEMEQLEPKKKKAMQRIIFLTKEAFENDNLDAKDELNRQKTEIEQLNSRVGKLQEEIEQSSEQLRRANLSLLRDTMVFVFTTLRSHRDRSAQIRSELAEMEARTAALNAELEGLTDDWTDTSVYFTELVGPDLVKQLEAAFLGGTEAPAVMPEAKSREASGSAEQPTG